MEIQSSKRLLLWVENYYFQSKNLLKLFLNKNGIIIR